MIHTLESGLRVVVHPTPGHVSSVHLWFDAGAVDETPAKRGRALRGAHALQGHPPPRNRRAAAEIEGLGGDLNAYTSWDETVLHANVVGGVDQALDVLFDMARNPRFDPEETERERLVVLEELHSYQGDPDTVAIERMQQRVFGSHPYGRPVIGHEGTVQNLTRAQLQGFWRRHYHPGRALLTVVGPVEPRDILQRAHTLSDGWAHGALRSTIRQATPRTAGGHELIRGTFEGMVVAMGWPGPAIGHPDEAALDVLAFGLGEGAAARLTVLLELELAVATQVWADASHWLGGGLVSLGFGSPSPEHAVGYTLRELARVVRHGLPPAEIERAKQGILTDLWFAAESSHGVAAELAWSAARLGDPAALVAYKQAVEQVTPEQVQTAAARWMNPDAAQIVVLDKTAKEPALRREIVSARRAGPPPPTPAGRCGDLDVVDVGGIRVAVRRTDSPVAAVQVLAPGGQLYETTRTAGLAEAWSRTVVRAAGPHDPRALATEADALALRLAAAAGRTAQRLSATFPAHQLTPALGLLGQVLVAPQFDGDDWDQIREAMVDELRSICDDGQTVAYEALWRGLWPRHPFRFATLGTEAALRHITVGRLQRHHRTTMAAGALVVGVAGGVEPEAVYRAIEAWSEGVSRELVPPPAPPPSPPTQHRTVRRAGQSQAVVELGTRGVPHHHRDRLALEIACHLLDSQAGRLFIALREAKGLAYSVWASSATNSVGGVFSVGIATDPGRAREAERGLHEELLRLRDDGPAPAELARTVQLVRGSVLSGQQRVSAQATTIARALLTEQDPRLERLEAELSALTPQQIQDALGRLELAAPLRVTVLPP